VGWRQSGLAEQEGDFLSDALLGLILCLMGIYLCWLDFRQLDPPNGGDVGDPLRAGGGDLGALPVWDVPLSMFSVVGLIGMSGIIINDSIVLVTHIDEYAQTARCTARSSTGRRTVCGR
jgi:multidrug efflux pump subunit AcrB